MTIYTSLAAARASGRKQLAVLLDPDKITPARIQHLAESAGRGLIDYFFWGGSLVSDERASEYFGLLRQASPLPIVLFPGSARQLDSRADALLLLSLISGRNPDLLIGRHVHSALRIKRLGVEVIPTGYLLVDGGRLTSAVYISGTQPLPADKPDLARVTALAGTQLGLRLIYLDAGSGALQPVSPDMIRAVRAEIDTPLIVGGGIRDARAAETALRAGADLIVVGNGLEENDGWLSDLCGAVRACGT
ncbi:MAG: geranylgeranylglyceryl/heptaprenylglyceryl phosphate synthase [Saprospiraceae bacterium]